MGFPYRTALMICVKKDIAKHIRSHPNLRTPYLVEVTRINWIVLSFILI